MFKDNIWEAVAKRMQFLPDAAARNARLRKGGGWKGVLNLAVQLPSIFIFRHLSFKASSQHFNGPQQETVAAPWVSNSE